MFIQTEQTPNPETLKFLPGRPVLPDGSRDFPVVDRTAPSPLVRALAEIEGVRGVFLGADFITITRAPGMDWAMLKPAILGAIMDHFTQNLPLLDEGAAAPAGADDADPLVVQIKDIIDTRVRPAVAQDGGDIIFDRFADGVVYLHLQGSCAGCPSSTATLKSGIENMLRHFVPEVTEVRAVPR